VKKLYVIDGPIKGKSFKLNDAITNIGRASDNEICISDIGVSWQHAKFLKRNGRIFIVDLNSSQGVFIDREKIEPGLEVEIKKESILHIGNIILSFQKRSSEEKFAKLYHANAQRKPLNKRETLFVKDSSRNYIRSLELLLKVSNIFAQSLNIDELLGEVIDWVFNLLRRIDRGAILLLDKETGKLKEMVSKTRMEDKDGLFSKISYNG
jgi:adenylate cyclase